MSDIVIQVSSLSKRYRLGVIGTGTLSHDLNRWWAKVRGKPDPTLKVGQGARGKGQEAAMERQKESGKGSSPLPLTAYPLDVSSDYVWALRGVSFEVKRGEVLGIIGGNGAGKSTLLKILSRVTAPTDGVVRLRGRVGSLLEVGTGFHPELTGRENVFLNGAILGMSRRDIQSKFEAIVDFSEVSKYIDTPVKRYSSGMYVRLAFAVAAHLDPELLIVDEVLAVGDVGFQRKCLGKMHDVSEQGRTVLFVSHNMGAIKQLCSHVLLLKNGSIACQGKPEPIVDSYLSGFQKGHVGRRISDPGYDIRIERAVILDSHRNETTNLLQGTPFDVVYTIVNRHARTTVGFGISVEDSETERLFASYTVAEAVSFDLPEGKNSFRYRAESLPLNPGTYYISVAVHLANSGLCTDRIEQAIRFTVDGPASKAQDPFVDTHLGPVHVEHVWASADTRAT